MMARCNAGGLAIRRHTGPDKDAKMGSGALLNSNLTPVPAVPYYDAQRTGAGCGVTHSSLAMSPDWPGIKSKYG